MNWNQSFERIGNTDPHLAKLTRKRESTQVTNTWNEEGLLLLISLILKRYQDNTTNRPMHINETTYIKWTNSVNSTN